MKVPYTVSSESITVFVEGKMKTVLADSRNFDELRDHLKQEEHDIEKIKALSDKEIFIRGHLGTNSRARVEDGQVLYDGKPVHSTLTKRLLDLLEEGFDVKPWLKFLENLMLNPSYRSREALFDFLDNFKAPITEDGCFIAFKRVRSNYYDIHSGKFYNGVGSVVSMPREQVDDDNKRTCSAGLHVCADEYLKGYATFGTYRTMIVKVNPRDVVSVPYDYNFSKMRTCQYEVIAEAEDPDRLEDYYDSSYWEVSDPLGIFSGEGDYDY